MYIFSTDYFPIPVTDMPICIDIQNRGEVENFVCKMYL